jgi:hypothetical protein
VDALESVQLAQAKIRSVRDLLRTPSAATLDQCLDELGETARILEIIIKDAKYELTPEIVRACREIRDAARGLRLQIGYASQFWLGWMQMRLGSGYTSKGAPVLLENQARGSFEV